MITKQKVLIASVVGVLLVIALGTWAFLNWDSLWPSEQVVSTSDPIDVTLDFYNPWLTAWQATTTNPYKEGLHKDPILSKELRKRLQKEGPDMKEGVDLVMCQPVPPPNISARVISESEMETQVLILSTQKEFTGQAIVSLLAKNEGWYINTITCALGEFAPEREFSFDREGYLLKSVPPPYNPAYWHLVFEENGQKGHAAPLFFNAESSCTALDGKVAVCNPDQFRETTKVSIKGSMTELGVEVKKLELVK